MGRRHSVASNIVLKPNAPAALLSQLNAMVSTKQGEPLHKFLWGDDSPLPATFNANVAALFRDHRHYGAEYKQRKVIVPDRHYVAYGTTKSGDYFVRQAVDDLLPYLDLRKSWFVALDEGCEILVIRWDQIGDKLVRNELVRDLIVQDPQSEFSTPTPPYGWEDCHNIPWYYAELIVKTIGTSNFKQTVRKIQSLLCDPGQLLAVAPLPVEIEYASDADWDAACDRKPNRREGSWRYKYYHGKAKKGKGVKYYRTGEFFPAIRVTFKEEHSPDLTAMLNSWMRLDFVSEPGMQPPKDMTFNRSIGPTTLPNITMIDSFSVTRGTENESDKE